MLLLVHYLEKDSNDVDSKDFPHLVLADKTVVFVDFPTPKDEDSSQSSEYRPPSESSEDDLPEDTAPRKITRVKRKAAPKRATAV